MQRRITELKSRFNAFMEKCTRRSEMCQFWDGIVELANNLKNLILLLQITQSKATTATSAQRVRVCGFIKMNCV